jgi:sugar (pentulose or hexulose) kinase
MTGLAKGTPVVLGAGDTPASAIGAGAGTPGLACTILGTTCLNGLVVDKPLFDPRDLGLLFTVPVVCG